jgi:predicted MPP superfamily phosphohydrolase
MSDLRRTPRRFSDEAIAAFRAARWLTTSVWPGRRAYARWLRRGGLQGVRVDVPVPGLPAPLHGLRLVQISDLHGGVFLDEASLEPAVALVRSFEPHLLVITGDFVTRFADDVHALGGVFARLHAPLGKLAVFGNHDYRGRREGEIAAALRRQGVTVLRNASVALRHGGALLRIAGLEDLEESYGADLEAAVAGWDGEPAARVLLCHHPDVVEDLPPGLFHLVLSGHSHGGQIVLPLAGTVLGRWMPRRMRGDHAVPGGGLLHVNRGLGVIVMPFRLGAPAEVTCLTLRPAPPPAQVAV